MQIGDLLKQKGNKVFTVSPDVPVMDAIRILNEKKIGALMVTNEDGTVEGIITERDILHNFEHCADCKFVRDFMTPKEKLFIGHPNDSVEYVMSVFTTNRIRHLPIIDGDRLIGIISIGDVVKALLDSTKFENKVLKDYISGSYPKI